MATDLDMARTVSLLHQAAAFIDLEALELEYPVPRTLDQRTRIANINRALAQSIRNHIITIGG